MPAGRILIAVVGAVLAATTTVLVVVIVGVRMRNRRFIRWFTRLQRDRVNPNALRTAGTTASPHGVIEHVGRRSGAPYETPVGPKKDGDGWAIPLVYGPETAWARNIEAAGVAVLRVDGQRRRVDRIERVPVATTTLVSERFTVWLFGIREAMRMRDAGPAPVEPVQDPDSA